MDQRKSLDALRINRALPPERRRRPAAWVGVGVLLLAAAGGGWWALRPKPPAVRVAAAREATAGRRTLLNGSGYVTARRQATVSSKVTGKVLEVSTEEGMHVKAGQVLARLDDSNVQASLRLAESQLNSARTVLKETEAQLRQAQRELARSAALAREHILDQSALDRAQADADVLKARLDRQKLEAVAAEREVAVWRQQLEDTVIRAPFDGVVTSKNAQPGEMISPISAGGFTRTGICTIVDMGSLEIEVDVNESYIHRVEPAQPVVATLDAYPDWKIPCHVIAIIPTADRQKATVKVRVGFEKLDPRMLPDMGVKVAFQGTNETAEAGPAGLLIPKTALRHEGNRDIVFVLSGGHTERRAVKAGDTLDPDVVIRGGLSPGEKVLVDPPANLKDGQAVMETNR